MSGNTFAVAALKRLHADLGHQHKESAKETKRLIESMKHVEAVLKMLDPAINLAGIAKRRSNKPVSPYKHGDVFRRALAVLRESDHPMTAKELAVILWQNAGITPTPRELQYMANAVQGSLRNRLGKTVERDDSTPARWRLAANGGGP